MLQLQSGGGSHELAIKDAVVLATSDSVHQHRHGFTATRSQSGRVSAKVPPSIAASLGEALRRFGIVSRLAPTAVSRSSGLLTNVAI